MNAADDLDEAKGRALRYIQARERSRREVERRLGRYGYGDEVVAHVVAWLEQLGYVDDRRFSDAYAREKVKAGWGARRIRAGLSACGVPTAVVAEAVDNMTESDAGSEMGRPSEEILVRMVERRFGRDWVRDQEGTTRRAAAFLQRRGHDWETIRRVLAAALANPDLSDS